MDTPLAELDPGLYQHLRTIAHTVMARHQRPNQTLQATALLHEAWMKLERSNARFENRAHFVSLVVRVMRQIAVDYARERASKKRGGDRFRTTLSGLSGENDPVDLLALDQALKELEAVDPRSAQIVLLKTFGGLTIAEIADVVGVSQRTVSGDWTFACAWLFKRLGDGGM